MPLRCCGATPVRGLEQAVGGGLSVAGGGIARPERSGSPRQQAVCSEVDTKAPGDSDQCQADVAEAGAGGRANYHVAKQFPNSL